MVPVPLSVTIEAPRLNVVVAVAKFVVKPVAVTEYPLVVRVPLFHLTSEPNVIASCNEMLPFTMCTVQVAVQIVFPAEVIVAAPRILNEREANHVIALIRVMLPYICLGVPAVVLGEFVAPVKSSAGNLLLSNVTVLPVAEKLFASKRHISCNKGERAAPPVPPEPRNHLVSSLMFPVSFHQYIVALLTNVNPLFPPISDAKPVHPVVSAVKPDMAMSSKST